MQLRRELTNMHACTPVAVTRYSPSRDEVRNPNRTELLKPTRSFPDISRYAFPARQLRQRSLTVTTPKCIKQAWLWVCMLALRHAWCLLLLLPMPTPCWPLTKFPEGEGFWRVPTAPLPPRAPPRRAPITLFLDGPTVPTPAMVDLGQLDRVLTFAESAPHRFSSAFPRTRAGGSANRPR